MMAEKGRPTKKTEDILNRICERIATSSDGLHAICQDKDMPSAKVVYDWLKEDADFRNSYARAKEIQADFLVEEIITIADDTARDTIHVENDSGGYDMPNHEWISRSKLKVDVRKWAASKLAPKKYGDKLDIDISDQRKVVASVFPDELDPNE